MYIKHDYMIYVGTIEFIESMLVMGQKLEFDQVAGIWSWNFLSVMWEKVKGTK